MPAVRLEAAGRGTGQRSPRDHSGPIEARGENVHLLERRQLIVVEQLHIGAAVRHLHHGLGQLSHARAAFGESVRLHRGAGARLAGYPLDDGDLLRRVVRETVDRNDRRHAELFHDADGVGQVDAPLLHRICIGRGQVVGSHPAVPLEPADGGDNDGRVRLDATLPHLDVHVLLEAEVGAESGLRDHVIGAARRQVVGDDRRAAVGDVAERPHVDDGGLALGGLDEVGLESVLQ